MEKVLYLRYRPNTLDDMIGNADIVEILKSQLSGKSPMPKSMLFYGPTGTGKTTFARIIANMLEIKGGDLKEIDSADFRGIETIREIRRQSSYQPLEGKYRLWILDECHKLTNDAQNALLKALEDTLPHVFYILCTTEPEKLLATIKGRCAQYQTKPLSDREMKLLLRRTVKQENESLAKQVYDQIILNSLGEPRTALQALQQVLSVEDSQRLQIAEKSVNVYSKVIDLCRILLKENKNWKDVANILNGLKNEDTESIRRAVLGYCQAVLLGNRPNPIAAVIMQEFVEPFYSSGFPGLVFACYSTVFGE